MSCKCAALRAASSSSAARLAQPRCTARPHRALDSGLRPAASSNKQQQPAAPSDAAPEAPVYREFQSLGMKVVETNQTLPEPETKDFWEGDQFESFGKVLENYFIPGVVVLGIIIGGWAAKNYDNDADIFIKPAGGPDQAPQVVFAAPPAAAPELVSQ